MWLTLVGLNRRRLVCIQNHRGATITPLRRLGTEQRRQRLQTDDHLLAELDRPSSTSSSIASVSRPVKVFCDWRGTSTGASGRQPRAVPRRRARNVVAASRRSADRQLRSRTHRGTRRRERGGEQMRTPARGTGHSVTLVGSGCSAGGAHFTAAVTQASTQCQPVVDATEAACWRARPDHGSWVQPIAAAITGEDAPGAVGRRVPQARGPSTTIRAFGSPKPGIGRPQYASERYAARLSMATGSRHSTRRGQARQAITSASRAIIVRRRGHELRQ